MDENRHRYFVVYFYSITAWINGAVGESSEFASDKSQHCAAIKTPLRVERRRSYASGNSRIKRSTSSTIWSLPTKNERRWCRVSGIISRIRSLPSLALPPACSARMPSGCTHTVNVVYRPGGWRCLGRDKYRLSAGYGGNPRPVNRYNVRYTGGWWIYLLLAEFNVLLHPVRKLNVVSFVDGVGFAFLREAHPFWHRQKTPSEGS